MLRQDPRRCFNCAFRSARRGSCIALDPRLDATDFKAAKDDLEKAGCTLRITQLDLYQIDEMTIDLEADNGR